MGMLKSRFGRLRDGFRNVVRDDTDCKRINSYIVAACILHNVCISTSDNCNDVDDYNLPELTCEMTIVLKDIVTQL